MSHPTNDEKAKFLVNITFEPQPSLTFLSPVTARKAFQEVHHRRALTSTMTWLETLPSLAILTFAIAAIGSLQSGVHRAYYGKVLSVADEVR